MSDATTDRLLLRHWTDADREPFAALNADPEVMRHFPSALDRAGSDALVDRIAEHLDREAWGLWAVEVVETGEFIGFTGLSPVPDDVAGAADLPSSSVEVGWRLAKSAWGHGYASEAARHALKVAFDDLGLDEVVSFTAAENLRSRAVMERIGLRHDAAHDFDHPRVPAGHRLRAHVLYRSI